MPDYEKMHFASACGRLELFARVYAGEGPALLLLHGLTRNSADFGPLAAHLAGRYRLIVPDQRGRGLSDYDPEAANYTPVTYVADMFALLDVLEIPKAAVIGTSMGGLMAMMMAAQAPERIGPVVLNDIGPELAPAGLARIGSYVGPSQPCANWDEAAQRCAQFNAQAMPGFTHADWLAFARRVCRETAKGSVVFAYDPSIAEAFDPDGGGETADLWPAFAALGERPLLLLRGALSDLLTAQTAAEMQRRHAGPFDYVEVPKRGHAPILDEPSAVTAITAFLQQHAR